MLCIPTLNVRERKAVITLSVCSDSLECALHVYMICTKHLLNLPQYACTYKTNQKGHFWSKRYCTTMHCVNDMQFGMRLHWLPIKYESNSHQFANS